MDFGKINASSLSTPSSALDVDKEIRLLYTAATSGPPPRPACPSILMTINMI
jgi:hypothetical protein